MNIIYIVYGYNLTIDSERLNRKNRTEYCYISIYFFKTKKQEKYSYNLKPKQMINARGDFLESVVDDVIINIQ